VGLTRLDNGVDSLKVRGLRAQGRPAYAWASPHPILLTGWCYMCCDYAVLLWPAMLTWQLTMQSTVCVADA
jgi:hypothetical protein